MRKLLAVLTASLCVGGLMASASGAAAGRTVVEQYTLANGMIAHESAEAHVTFGTGYTVFRPKPGERSVSFEVIDNSGIPARGHVHIHYKGEETVEHADDFCSETPKPIKLAGVKKLEVAVAFGSCPDGTPALVTEGTITATFSK